MRITKQIAALAAVAFATTVLALGAATVTADHGPTSTVQAGTVHNHP